MYVSRTDSTTGEESRRLVGLLANYMRPVTGCLSTRARARLLWPPHVGPEQGCCRPLGPYVDTTVYVDRLSCYVVAVNYEVANGPGDLVWLAEAAEGNLFLELLLGFLGDAGDHVGLNKPGADCVHGDPGAGQFLSRCLGEAEQPGLGRRVVGLADIAGLADKGAHVDDLAAALLGHVRQDRADRVEGAVEVYLDDLVPILDRELLQRAVYVDARVVDQYVHPVEFFHGLVYKVLGLLRVRDVSLNRDRFPAVLRDLLNQLLGRFLAPGVVDDDFCPPASQLLRY